MANIKWVYTIRRYKNACCLETFGIFWVTEGNHRVNSLEENEGTDLSIWAYCCNIFTQIKLMQMWVSLTNYVNEKVSQPHSGNSSVSGSHTRNVNVSEPHTWNVNVSEPHTRNVNVSEPHTQNVNVSEPHNLSYRNCEVSLTGDTKQPQPSPSPSSDLRSRLYLRCTITITKHTP